MLVPKLIMAVRTLIPIDEVRTYGEDSPLGEGGVEALVAWYPMAYLSIR